MFLKLYFSDSSVRDLVRVLIDMKKHVPGLQLLSTWHVQLIVSDNY